MQSGATSGGCHSSPGIILIPGELFHVRQAVTGLRVSASSMLVTSLGLDVRTIGKDDLSGHLNIRAPLGVRVYTGIMPVTSAGSNIPPGISQIPGGIFHLRQGLSALRVYADSMLATSAGELCILEPQTGSRTLFL